MSFENIKICPCCGASNVGKSCPNCMVYTGNFDPDDFMGEYEEENE